MKEKFRTIGTLYLLGVGISCLMAGLMVLMNWLAEQLLAYGYQVPFFPYTMYWSGTLIAILVIGPILVTVGAISIGFINCLLGVDCLEEKQN
jgi:hypothetical protein